MIHVVIGTKAQLVKMAPVLSRLQELDIKFNLIFTGQHRETVAGLRENFSIKDPDVVLYDGKDITSVTSMFAWGLLILWRVLIRRRTIFHGDRAGIVLVHGDTFSCLLGALMGKLCGLTVGHVESGLRSFDWFHPFPEEITRLLTFRLADVYFCPGEWALSNLRKYRGTKVDTLHNTLLDSLRQALQHAESVDVEIPNGPYAVVSVHRFENVFKRDALLRIVETIERIARRMPLLFILHVPTEQKLREFGLYDRLAGCDAIELRPRYDYFRFIKLVDRSEFLVTDGGSNQEESHYLGKPCLLLRKASERHEGLGQNVVLSKYDDQLIDAFVDEYTSFALDREQFDASPTEIIVDYVRRYV